MIGTAEERRYRRFRVVAVVAAGTVAAGTVATAVIEGGATDASDAVVGTGGT